MTRLIQMIEGAPPGPFLMKPLVNNFTKAKLTAQEME